VKVMIVEIIKKNIRPIAHIMHRGVIGGVREPSNHYRSALFIICFFAGACLPLFQTSLLPLVLLVLLALGLAGASLIWPCLRLVVYFCLGLCWSSYAFTNQLTEYFPPAYERVSIQLQGRVASLPKSTEGNQGFRFDVQAILGSNQEINDLAVLKNKRLKLSCYRCPYQFEPGQQWQLTVRLKRPHGYASWGAFDYEKYLFRHHIIATGYLRTKDTNILLAPAMNSFDTWRWRIKQKLNQSFATQSVGSQLILALAIGDKSGLTNDQKQVLQRSGTSHLMAISGLHVGLVFISISALFSLLLKPFARVFEYLPRQHIVLLPGLAGAFIYAGLAGFAVSTQRAFIMLSVYVVCRFIMRTPSLLKVLLITAFLVLLYDPNSLLDIGFWLSCGAVLIISMVGQSNVTDNSQMFSLFKLQPLLWLGMLPLVVAFFGQVSMVSPLVNLIAVPLFCLCLIPLTLSVVLLNQLSADMISMPALSFLQKVFDWVFGALQWSSDLSFASQVSSPLSYWVLLACALIVLAHMLRWSQRHWSWLLLAISVFMFENKPIQDKLLITLLDVGQGLAMVVEQEDYVLVYDTGPAYQTGFSAAQAVLLPYLNYRGVRELNTLIISHADNDHIGGYETLMGVFPAQQVLTSRVDKLPKASACIAGQAWSEGDVDYKIISPDLNTPDGSNNRSCVLRISYGDNTVLITGDIEKQVEKYLIMNSADLEADILLVPHQGSKTSSTAKFIDAVKPSLALIAAGYLNHYGHPHPKVVERYQTRNIELLSTIDAGSIQLELSLTGWQLEPYRVSQKRFWQHRKITQRL